MYAHIYIYIREIKFRRDLHGRDSNFFYYLYIFHIFNKKIYKVGSPKIFLLLCKRKKKLDLDLCHYVNIYIYIYVWGICVHTPSMGNDLIYI